MDSSQSDIRRLSCLVLVLSYETEDQMVHIRLRNRRISWSPAFLERNPLFFYASSASSFYKTEMELTEQNFQIFKWDLPFLRIAKQTQKQS